MSAAGPGGEGCGGRGDAASALQPQGAAGLRGLPSLGQGYEVPREWGSQRWERRHPADKRGKCMGPSSAMWPRPRHREKGAPGCTGLAWLPSARGHPGP